MSLRHFLNCGYTILLEEYQRWGKNLFEATDELAEYAEGFPRPDAVPASGNERAVVSQNQKAMTELSKLLGGVA